MNSIYSPNLFEDNYSNIISDKLKISEKEAENFIKKAYEGGEISDEFGFKSWFEERFFPNCILIDEVDYTKMCIDALKILETTAGTDYGTSRQRDLGQLWADMTRGYLGELAFVKFLKNRWNILSKLSHEKGILTDFLKSDIKQISKGDKNLRSPNLDIGIKTGKSNGVWLDITGDQFNHSDIHVFVKVATGRDHLFSFFKHISVFKDKILKKGEDIGIITQSESSEIFDKIPSFIPIPAYICGFVERDRKYTELSYTGRKARLHYTIFSWNGPYEPDDIRKIKNKENISARGKVKFIGIGEFSNNRRYLFNTGNLLWKNEDWNRVINKI